jgi:predicted anti-sigma-YlaC factor YlaD
VDCSEVLQQLADYLDQDARDELCRLIEAHLSRCHDCQLQVDTIRKTIVLYQHDRVVEMPVRVSQQLEAALAREYRQRAEGEAR